MMNLADISNSLPTTNKTKNVTFNSLTTQLAVGIKGVSPYLKKGDGHLASDYYKNTKFAKQRREKIIKEQQERERYGI